MLSHPSALWENSHTVTFDLLGPSPVGRPIVSMETEISLSRIRSLQCLWAWLEPLPVVERVDGWLVIRVCGCERLERPSVAVRANRRGAFPLPLRSFGLRVLLLLKHKYVRKQSDFFYKIGTRTAPKRTENTPRHWWRRSPPRCWWAELLPSASGEMWPELSVETLEVLTESPRTPLRGRISHWIWKSTDLVNDPPRWKWCF